MARRRKSSTRTGSLATEPVTESQGTTTQRSTTQMAGLTAEEIQALLGRSRTKGQYVVRLNEFVGTGEMGINVRETWVEFADKQASTLKQGFDNARDNKEAAEGTDQVKVIKQEDDVFLINLAVAASELGDALPQAAAA